MIFENFCYSKIENTKLLEKYKNPKEIRLKVFSNDVKVCDKAPKEYNRLMNRYVFDDHRRFLKVGNKCIGFIVSPYNLNTERHKALELDGHKVVEMRQYHHLNAETIAVIKKEYINVIIWKVFHLIED